MAPQQLNQPLPGAGSLSQAPTAAPPAEPDPDPVPDQETEKLVAERDELKDTLMRRQRDFDNYRKRTDRERGETFRNVVSNVASQMLPVLDNLNRALDASSEENGEEKGQDFQTFLEGIVLVNQQLNEVLTSMGVQQISAIGEPFDPQYHEAVEIVETDEYPPKTVIFEILRGYKVDDKIIRASMVRVSSEISTENSSSEPSSESSTDNESPDIAEENAIPEDSPQDTSSEVSSEDE